MSTENKKVSRDEFLNHLKKEVKRRLLLEYDEFHGDEETDRLYNQYLAGDQNEIKFIAEFIDEWRDDHDLHDEDRAVWGV